MELMGNALWQLIKQSDTVSKLVLLVLLIMSIVCWAIFFYKIILFRMKKKQLRAAVAQMHKITNLEQMVQAVGTLSGTMPGYFLSRNLAAVKEVLQDKSRVDGVVLSEQEWLGVQDMMHHTMDDMMYHEEQYLPFISTCGGVATLLGLFGTIWGLVHSFVRISELQSADIATVAPGIAEALITTLVGLMVAIPAVVMFNYLSVQVRDVEQHLVVLANRFGGVVQKLFVR